MSCYEIHLLSRYYSNADKIVYKPYKFRRYSDKNPPGLIGKFWQISKHSWGWETNRRFHWNSNPKHGKATTKDAALQACIRASRASY